MMQLNATGQLATLYQYTYVRPLPDNLCVFFWKILLAIALFPFTWVSYPWETGPGNVNGLFGRIIASFVSWLILGVAALLCIATYMEPMGLVYLVAGGIGLFLVILIGAMLFFFFQERPWQEPLGKIELVQVFRERKSAFKDRYCPKIEWK